MGKKSPLNIHLRSTLLGFAKYLWPKFFFETLTHCWMFKCKIKRLGQCPRVVFFGYDLSFSSNIFLLPDMQLCGCQLCFVSVFYFLSFRYRSSINKSIKSLTWSQQEKYNISGNACLIIVILLLKPDETFVNVVASFCHVGLLARQDMTLSQNDIPLI